MTDIQNLKVDQVDIDSIKRIHAEFKQNYEQRVSHLTSTFNQMLKDMKRDYDVQITELEKINQKVIANHNAVV
jgi:hypothetical protein